MPQITYDRAHALREAGELYSELASCFVPNILVGFGTWQYRYKPFVRFWDNTSLFTGDDI